MADQHARRREAGKVILGAIREADPTKPGPEMYLYQWSGLVRPKCPECGYAIRGPHHLDGSHHKSRA